MAFLPVFNSTDFREQIDFINLILGSYFFISSLNEKKIIFVTASLFL